MFATLVIAAPSTASAAVGPASEAAVAEPATNVASPVAEPVAKAGTPVTEPVTNAVTPAAEQVTEAATPVAQPVTKAVTEAAESTQQLTAPVRDGTQAATPVVEPVAEAADEAAAAATQAARTLTQTAAPVARTAADAAGTSTQTASAGNEAVTHAARSAAEPIALSTEAARRAVTARASTPPDEPISAPPVQAAPTSSVAGAAPLGELSTGSGLRSGSLADALVPTAANGLIAGLEAATAPVAEAVRHPAQAGSGPPPGSDGPILGAPALTGATGAASAGFFFALSLAVLALWGVLVPQGPGGRVVDVARRRSMAFVCLIERPG